MASSTKKLDIERLSTDEKLALVDEILASISDSDLPVTAAQRIELERRVADADAHPEAFIPWEDVKKMFPPAGG